MCVGGGGALRTLPFSRKYKCLARSSNQSSMIVLNCVPIPYIMKIVVLVNQVFHGAW